MSRETKPTFLSTDTKAIFLLVIGCIIFGLGSLIVAFVSVGAYAITVWRLSIASVVFLILFLFSKQIFGKRTALPLYKKTYIFMALAGVFLGLDLSLWHESIYAVGPGISTLLNSLQIFFLAAIGYVAFKEKLNTWQIGSLFIAIVGVALIASPEFTKNLKAGWGFITGVISGGMLAASMASIRKVHDIEKTDIIALMLVLNVSGALSMLPIALLMGDNFIPKSYDELGLILIYGAVMQCFAWGLIAYSIPKLSLTITGLVLLTEPVAAIVIDYFYLHKPITTIQWFGVGVTLIAIYIGSVNVNKK